MYAHAGRPDRARELLAEYESEIDEQLRRTEPFRHHVAGAVAIADGQLEEAITHVRTWDENIGCPICALPQLARAYDGTGEADSAIAVYERYIETPWLWGRLNNDSWYLAPAYKRLGELYEAGGDREKAVEYYSEFVDLWSDADEELQPLVRDVTQRLAKLIGER